MITTVVGALLLATGVVWGVAESGSDQPVLFLVPGVVLVVVGLILQSNAKTRQELTRIRVQLEAMDRGRPQAEQ
jgi:sulfite exporter TauE/SafE